MRLQRSRKTKWGKWSSRPQAFQADGADREGRSWFVSSAGRGSDTDQYLSPWVEHKAFHLSFPASYEDTGVIPGIEWTGGFHFVFGWFFGVEHSPEFVQSIDRFLEIRRRLFRGRGLFELFSGEISQGTSFVVTIHEQESTNPERKK